MNVITIRKPIWNGGKRAIGIAEYKLKNGDCKIQISYRDRFGALIYPNLFHLSYKVAMRCPVMERKQTRIRIVPIEMLEILA